MVASSPQPANQLLAALPESEYASLVPHLETVSLRTGQILYQPYELIEFVYFPNRAIVSLVAIMEDGATTEVGLVGKEGMVGLPVILGSNCSSRRAIVQIGNGAVMLNADILKREFDRGGELRRLLLLYTQGLLTQVSQTAACNRQHVIEERLARWLLSVQDRVEQDEFLLTQEMIAYMLGVRRSGITVAANILQRAGIISYSRGRIHIRDRQALEATACECYRLVNQEFQRLFGFN
ncbi:Crp/Fnr family transcriptional regulator [Pleurocapsales cyanobacterium LEGE 06147]|nr:Crp/Fnr family transcriptional regulator [Pleurocapsales cyanobacterium LEGE 06147]